MRPETLDPDAIRHFLYEEVAALRADNAELRADNEHLRAQVEILEKMAEMLDRVMAGTAPLG